MSDAPRQAATLLIEAQDGFDSVALTGTTTIGRDRRCDIVIDHPTASRMHARIWHDALGWQFQDLGSQNGTKLGETRLQTAARLTDGMAIRIGRVRAFFFAGAVPDTWRPPDEPEHAGKLIRCRCGHIGWAPKFTAGMTLNCSACGRDLVHHDSTQPSPSPAPDPAARAAVDCAACHTTIEPTEPIHQCPECGAQMHVTCWRELGGCAMYGCGQVNHPDASDLAPQGPTWDEPGLRAADASFESRPIEKQPSLVRYRLAQCGLVVLVGLPTFGIPAIAFGAHRLVTGDAAEGKRRFGYAAIAFIGGVLGFIVSAYWWLGGPRPWRLL